MREKSNCTAGYRYILTSFWFLLSVVSLPAEVTRLPFLYPAPVFTDEPEAFPHVAGWLALDHTLNQDEFPDSGHCYELGTVFTFFSCKNISVSGIAREMFQFRASPLGDFYLWARDLVTDLRLGVWYDADMVKIGAGYRHDCKHDIETQVRTVIHDALFTQILVPSTPLPVAQDILHPQAALTLEAEININPVFQAAEAEPDKGRITVECELVPVSLFSGTLSVFADGRCSWIYRDEGGRIPVATAWNSDGIFRTGIACHTGKGDIRLFWYYERTTDNWASLTPVPETISAVAFSLTSHFL
jgi:hypothetical protein